MDSSKNHTTGDRRCYAYHSDSDLFNKLKLEHDWTTAVEKKPNKQTKNIQYSWKGLCKYFPFIGTLDTWTSSKLLLNIIQVFYTRLQATCWFNFCQFRQLNQYSKKCKLLAMLHAFTFAILITEIA